MSQSSDNQGIIRQAAGIARERLGRVALCRWLVASHVWIGIGGLVLIAALRWFGGLKSTPLAVGMAVGLIAIWLLAGWLWSLLRRPSELQALSIWDESGDWKDTFSSALAFEKKVLLEEGERLHVERARQTAVDAIGEIRSSLPAPSVGAVWVLPLLMLAFAFTSLLVRPGEAGDAELTDEMRAAAEREAELLAEEAAKIENITDLAKDDEDEIEKLKEAVEGVSEELADAEGKSAREVLEALEERARAAERLADKLGAADNAWASEEMLAEMGQHADTADLATAIRDKNAEASSAQADLISATLDREDLTREGQQRIAEALDRTMQKATEEDHAKPVGEHVGNASRKMGTQQPKPAARDFKRLADHFRTVMQREKAQQELKALAEKLREAGSKISGAKMEPMKQLAGNQGSKVPPGQVQPLGAPPQGSPMTQTPQGSQPGQTGAPNQTLQAPGLQNMQTGQAQPGQKGQQAAPVPGSQGKQQPGQKGQQGLAAGQSGSPKKPGKKAALSAPIPGMNPGQGPSGASLGGQSQQGSLSSNGGLEAGNATAELGNDQSTAMKATDESTVQAQINEDGESTLRAVDGQARAEQAQVERREAAVNFIQVEEDALDEQALPLSRREHVLKYFTELRERFENEEAAGAAKP